MPESEPDATTEPESAPAAESSPVAETAQAADSGKAAESTQATESAETAVMDAPSSAAAKPPARKVHRFLIPSLLVLATILGIVGSFAVWVNRQALNTNNWASTSSKILENKEVQTALSAYLVHTLFTNVDVAKDLGSVLPPVLQPLAGPAAAGLQDLAGTLAPKVLANPQVQSAWVQANIATQPATTRPVRQRRYRTAGAPPRRS